MCGAVSKADALSKPPTCCSTIHSSGQMFIGEEVYDKTNESHCMSTELYCLCHKIGYIFQRNAVNHTISVDKNLSWPLSGVKGLRR